MIRNLRDGLNERKAAFNSSKEIEGRTYDACYTRWIKQLKKKSGSLLDKEDYDKSFFSLMLDLYKENQILNYKLAGLERRFQKIEKKLEPTESARQIGFRMNENE